MPLSDPIASFEEYGAAGGTRGLERALQMTPEAVIDDVEASGLRGRGGAGFPTGAKWRSIREAGAGTRFVVANGAEGEPATFKDRWLMRRNPYAVVEGLAIASFAVGAAKAYVGIKESFEREAEALARAIVDFRAAGLLEEFPINVVLGPDLYLFGEETGLLEVVEGRAPLPRILRPFMQGLFADATNENPTVVNNVETLANVSHILAEGADWWRASGTESSPGTMAFTLVGDVEHEGVFELPLGTPLRELIEVHGGGVRAGGAVKAVFPGASSAVLPAEALDVPMDFESFGAVGSGLGSAGFLVLDETACIVEAAWLYSRFLSIESCGQCPPCKLNSGYVTERLERLHAGRSDVGGLDAVIERAATSTDGQRCALPTGESLIVQSLMQEFREEFEAHLGRSCPHERRIVFPKLVDLDEQAGRFVYDETYGSRQPDWSLKPGREVGGS
ncbi:MAG TPA: NADH-ubiquinone oxidoreductase-F iron-sulfur binding region domain-containing protein [Actinomycetota bacterium]